MQIIDGRWVDDQFNPIDERTSPLFVELGRKVQSIYGKNITHDRIKLVNQLSSLDNKDEKVLSRLIDEGHLDKLINV